MHFLLRSKGVQSFYPAVCHLSRRQKVTSVLVDSYRHHHGTRRILSTCPAISSNQEIVPQNLEQSEALKSDRRRHRHEMEQKNLHIKSLLENRDGLVNGTSSIEDDDNKNSNNNNNNNGYPVPPLYAVKVWVDNTLREELRLSGREKRGRVFIETGTAGTCTLKGLKMEMYNFFRALRKDTFVLQATFPKIDNDGNLVANDDPSTEHSWMIETDEDVLKTFQAADSFYQNATTFMKRPSIQINVLKNPDAPPPLPPPHYLINMPDPSISETITMISFYSFYPPGIQHPDHFANTLRRLWKPFQVLGRVYVAQEGVNAQMSVPTNVLSHFMECCRSIPELGTYMENGINIDPKPLTRDEFAVAGVPLRGQEPAAPPFSNLHIRVRSQIVADGLEEPLSWQSAGYDCPPMEWHQRLKRAVREIKNNDTDAAEEQNRPILLDCRNSYESQLGRFEGAEPLNTENFRDSWKVLEERLADTPKDVPIMAYCTGGIRCVKVGAYLTQKMGFTNVSRLAGGIIAYDRTLKEEMDGEEESMFKGTNFVFDGRLGRPITDDALAVCVTCGNETSLVSNCRNNNCHKRITQCESCQTSFHGTCSDWCKNRVIRGTKSGQLVQEDEEPGPEYTSLESYSLGHSSPISSVYREMELNTQAHFPWGAHMVSGAAQGQLLTQLASMTRHGRILEIGTFSGYATACFLEGARNVGQVTGATNGSAKGGPFVLSMERDAEAFNLAVAHIRAFAKYCGEGEDGTETIRKLRDTVPVTEEDTVSVSMEGIAGCDLYRVRDALATIEAIAQGNAKVQPAPFDLVFLDADKTRFLDYIEVCLSSDKVLDRGGMILIDNVLWKGLVLEASSSDNSKHTNEDASLTSRRARRLASRMHQFNRAILKDERVEVMMLPIRDGLSLIRKR